MFKRRRWTVLSLSLDSAAMGAFGSLEQVFDLSGTPAARDSESIVIKVTLGSNSYYVKRYHKTKGVRSWLGLSRIRKEAQNQLLFKQLEIPAAEVVAYGEDHVLSKTIRGALITLALENTADLASIAQQKPDLVQDRRWARQVIVQVADMTRRLHDYRFCHNDLKWRNILVTLDEKTPQAYLIDCPVGQRWPAVLLQRRIIKDLACLDKVAKYQLSQTQRLFFFKKYMQRRRLTAADKRMIRRVLIYFEGRE